MKSITYFSALLLLITSSVVFTSCDKDDETNDTTPPAIRVISPAEGAVLMAGEAISLEVTFSDNTKLASYKINIHSAAGHTHDDDDEELTHDHDDDDIVYYTYNASWKLPEEKTVQITNKEIIIPVDATNGDYHFMVYCSDYYGNVSYVAINIEIAGGVDHDHSHDHDHDHNH